MALQYASEDLKADKEVVLAGEEQWLGARVCLEDLLADKDVVLVPKERLALDMLGI